MGRECFTSAMLKVGYTIMASLARFDGQGKKLIVSSYSYTSPSLA